MQPKLAATSSQVNVYGSGLIWRVQELNAIECQLWGQHAAMWTSRFYTPEAPPHPNHPPPSPDICMANTAQLPVPGLGRRHMAWPLSEQPAAVAAFFVWH